MCHHSAVLEGVHSSTTCLPELWNVCFRKFKQPQAPVFTIARQSVCGIYRQRQKMECCLIYSEEVDNVWSDGVVMQRVCWCVDSLVIHVFMFMWSMLQTCYKLVWPNSCWASLWASAPMFGYDVLITISPPDCGEHYHWECCWHMLSVFQGM